MRQQRKDVGPKFKEAQRELRCYFLRCFSAPYGERISAASGAHCTFFEQYHALKTFGIDHSYEARVKCKIGYDGGLLLFESLRSPRKGQLRSITTSHEKWQKIQYYAEKLRAPRCPGFYRLVLLALLQPASLTSSSQDYKSVCYKPSHRTTNKHGETRYRLNCREDRCNRKRIHTHFLKDRNCEMQDPCLHLRISFASHSTRFTLFIFFLDPFIKNNLSRQVADQHTLRHSAK